MKVLTLTRYGALGASSRLRFLQLEPHLRNAGVDCVAFPLLDDLQLQMRYAKGRYGLSGLLRAYFMRIGVLLRRKIFDVIWIEKEALPWTPTWLERELLQGMPYVLDYDDAIFHNYDRHSSRLVRHFLGDRIDRLMAGASSVVVGNSYLAWRAHRAGARRVEVLPTVVDLNRYTPIKASGRSARVPRVVWIGSPSTVRYLNELREPLVSLRRQLDFVLQVITRNPIDLPDVNVEFVPWSEETEVSALLEGDVGVMPLPDSPWERGKCGYKLIQYMACGLPVVASPVGANKEIVRVGENGFLASTDREWVETLAMLLKDGALRQRMGEAGRKRVEQEYCVQQVAPKFTSILRSALEN